MGRYIYIYTGNVGGGEKGKMRILSASVIMARVKSRVRGRARGSTDSSMEDGSSQIT